MKKLRLFALIAFSFGAGAFVSHVAQPATAAAPPVVATAIDLTALTPADLPSPNATFPNLRTKLLAVVDSTSFAYQAGTASKHTHTGTTEVQLFLDGTGTEWLGDKEIPIKPGTFVLIPPNTPHAGFTGGPFKFYTVKTPLQDPTDYHLLP